MSEAAPVAVAVKVRSPSLTVIVLLIELPEAGRSGV